jgi:hypothetical protein
MTVRLLHLFLTIEGGRCLNFPHPSPLPEGEGVLP